MKLLNYFEPFRFTHIYNTKSFNSEAFQLYKVLSCSGQPSITYAVHKRSSVAGCIERQTEKPFLFKILAFILELYFRFLGWNFSKINIKLFRCAGEGALFSECSTIHHI